MSRTELLLTCEHGGRRVPARYRSLFENRDDVLASHRGWDPGALDLARHLRRVLRAPLFFSQTTRLLVELNRPRGHRRLFSEFTRRLPEDTREKIVAQYYAPYWDELRRHVATRLRDKRVRILHVSCHSFTPVWDGVERDVDLGLLYDAARTPERELCHRWADDLRASLPGLRVRLNRPYRGDGPGVTTELRKLFGARRYLGIELELSQRLVFDDGQELANARAALTRVIAGALAE